MNGSTANPPNLMPPMPWLSRARSFSPHRSRARAHASKRVASTSLPSTSPNSKKPNPASPAPALFSQTQIPPSPEPTAMKSHLPLIVSFLPNRCFHPELSLALRKTLRNGQIACFRHFRFHPANFPSLPSSPVLFFLSQ